MAAQDKVTFKQDLTEPVKIRHYEGVVFTGDDCGNLIKVALFDGGVPYSGGGTVSATAVLADGTTFPLTQGSITGNMVSVPLEAGALVVSGLMGLYVKISGGGIICTVLNAIFTVQVTDTGRVPAATVTTVNELVAAIRDAQDSIPADLTNLLAAVAPTFSTSTAYSAGAYVWQGGKLYRFTAAHPAGTWTGTGAVTVALGDDVADLKSALNTLQPAATGADVGKTLIVKTVVDGKPTEYEYGEAGCSPADILVHGKNLFDGVWTEGYFVNQTNGQLEERTLYKVTDFIQIEPSKPYTISASYNSSYSINGLRYAVYDENKDFISGAASTPTFTSESNAKYVRFSLLKILTNAQLEEGTTYTSYEPYEEYLDPALVWSPAIEKNVEQKVEVALGNDVADLKSAFESYSKQIINVFNPANVTTGKKLTYSAGYSIETLQNQANSALSEIIPCCPGDVITLRPGIAATTAGTSNNYGIVFAGSDGIILSAVNQPNRNEITPYTATAPEGATCFRFNVNTNYESDLTKKYCTINRGTLPYAVPYGVLAVPQAGGGLLGGINAEEKTNDDTQEVKIDGTTGKLYVNVNPATSDNRRFFAPAIYYGNNANQKIPWRSIYWARQMDSVYYRSPNTTTVATNKVMPKYFVMTAPSGFNQARTSGAMNIHSFDAKTDKLLESVQITTRFINPAYLTNPTSEKNLLVTGDSFIQNSVIPDRIRAKLDEYGLTNIKLIGTRQTQSGVKHEGHGGHAYIDYISNPSSLSSSHVNPFWHDGVVDFTWYASECGVNTIDYVIVHLGVNDLLDGTSAEQLVTNMTTFVGYIHSAFPSAVVVIDGLVIPSMDCPSNYNPIDQALKIHNYNAAIDSGANAITNTYYAPVVAMFNAEYAYPYTMQAPVEGSTESVKVLTDYLHPYTPGYYQIADEALWCLLYNASGI